MEQFVFVTSLKTMKYWHSHCFCLKIVWIALPFNWISKKRQKGSNKIFIYLSNPG